jgi:DNA end-binding protein Ku
MTLKKASPKKAAKKKSPSKTKNSSEHHGRSSVWKGSISFGLLNIPVSLQTAETHQEIHFSMLDKKDFSHIKYIKTNEKTGDEVPQDRIVKAYEYDKGDFVVMDDEDFKRANVKATQSIDIEEFVLLEEVDPLLFDKPYYVVPQKGSEKGYFLLREALTKSRKVAVGRVVISTKQHLVLLMPLKDHLVLEILRFPHEIKPPKQIDLPETNIKFSSKEVTMALDLINSMTVKWEPAHYKDTYYDDLMKRIEMKVKAGKGKEVEEDESQEAEVKPTENAVDLMPLLEQSLASYRKRGNKKPQASKDHSWH